MLDPNLETPNLDAGGALARLAIEHPGGKKAAGTTKAKVPEEQPCPDKKSGRN